MKDDARTGSIDTVAKSATLGAGTPLHRCAPDARKAVPLELVVVRQLLARLDAPPRKDANARLPFDDPLLSLAVGAAGVVDEACQAPPHGGVQRQAPATGSSPSEYPRV